MKRIFCLLLMTGLMLSMMTAAQAKTYELSEGKNGYFACEDFEGMLPEMAKDIFGNLILEGDEILCGTLFQEHYRNTPGKTNRAGALMAVRREGKILLMSANGKEGYWIAGIETDSFLPPDARFSLNCELKNHFIHLMIDYQDTAYEIRTTSEGCAYLYGYSWMDSSGQALSMDCRDGEFVLREQGDWPYTILAEGKAVPVRLAAWTADALPKTAESLHAFEQAYPLVLDDDEAYITDVNLRESATGKSETWGIYTAKVKMLGQKPGNDAPWFNVRVGNLEGWASGVYVHRSNASDQRNIYGAAMKVHPVGRARRQTALLDAYGGETIMQLDENAYVHVLGERDGYLHVIVPREELNWQTDWDGTYGYVKAADMAVGISKADAKYKN